jgi:hypothetical protein
MPLPLRPAVGAVVLPPVPVLGCVPLPAAAPLCVLPMLVLGLSSRGAVSTLPDVPAPAWYEGVAPELAELDVLPFPALFCVDQVPMAVPSPKLTIAGSTSSLQPLAAAVSRMLAETSHDFALLIRLTPV